MDRTDSAHWIDFNSDTEMKSCMLCEKTTKSHGILLAIEDDSGGPEFVAVTDQDDADTLMAVCHTCYREVDGDAAAAAARYNEKLQDVTAPIQGDFVETANRAKKDVERQDTINEGDVDTGYATLEQGDIVSINGHGPYMILEQLVEDRDGGFYVTKEDEAAGDDDYWLHRGEGDEVVLKEGAPGMPGMHEVVSEITYESNAMLKLSELMDERPDEVAAALRQFE